MSQRKETNTKSFLHSVFLTDLYQLTMAQAYFEKGMTKEGVFEFFVRRLPPNRNFLIAAGLEQALQFVEGFAFRSNELEWLEKTQKFKPRFLDYLAKLKFTGDINAVPEGTIFFQNEPIFQVIAPIIEAQLLETRLTNILHFQTLIASKAARCTISCQGKVVVDFGLRRAHGGEAGLLAARASYLAGMDGTSNVEANFLFDVPLYGTMAHSFIQAHDSEQGAFEDYLTTFPENATLLVDTYDTIAAVKRLGDLAKKLEPKGISFSSIRLDSGDLASLSREAREILDRSGLSHVKIFVSGTMDELSIADLLGSGAPIDGFGVGTRVITSADCPYLDCVYKLQEYAGKARMKLSTGKATWPGQKQVYRHFDSNGLLVYDTVALAEEVVPEGEPLLMSAMKSGRVVEKPQKINSLRAHALEQLKRLPVNLRDIRKYTGYEVKISEKLRALSAKLDTILHKN